MVTETMRGVWMSFTDLSTLLADKTPTQAAATLDEAMDTCVTYGFNTVFFHVRSHNDARYNSRVYAPSSDTAPLLQSGFDPLDYAVQAAHSRNLQLHAWINPYRIGVTRPNGDAPTHFQKESTWYYAPSDPAARQLVLDGVREILDHYAVDGIHFDDYFYPSSMAEDGEAFEAIPNHTDVTAWRQSQVDMLISAVHGLCRSHGKIFGISPAANIEQTAKSGANVTRWLSQRGYVDYLIPQLYTGFLHETHPFSALLSQWATLPRHADVRLYVGLALYKTDTTDPYAGSGRDEWMAHHDIIIRQARLSADSTDGYAVFRYGFLTATSEEAKRLKTFHSD